MSSVSDRVQEKVRDAVEFVQEKTGILQPPHVSTQKSRSIYATSAEDKSKPQKPSRNNTIVWEGPNKVGIKDMGYPEMKYPKGPRVNHGVVLKVIATNICGSDLHMYRGHIGGATPGMALGHEVTGEIVEMGEDVERFELGDIVSVPFNVACGRCDNCREQKTSACLKTCGELGAGGAYGFPMMGGWTGGQTEYHFVPYADFQLLRLPKDRAISKMTAGLAFLSDIFPTGYNGALQAGVKVGSIVFISGAGPVGLCAAQASFLLGAGCVFIADKIPARLRLAEKIGCKTIDLNDIKGGSSDSDHIMEQISKMLPPEKNGQHTLVDAAIDCVGYECCGAGRETDKRVSEQCLNTCIKVTKAGGRIGVPGIYAAADPSGANADNKQGIFHINYGLSWNKGQQIGQGQCPVMAYNLELMKAILYERVNLQELLNVKIISLEEAPEAYKTFNDGEAAKYVIDPHGVMRPRA